MVKSILFDTNNKKPQLLLGFCIDLIRCCELYGVEIGDQNFSVELGPNYLLSVAGHHTTTWCEVHWIIDQWGLDEWDVWSVHCAGF